MAQSSARKLSSAQEKPLEKLAEFGQSIWMDFIDRDLIESGKLASWISQGLRGLTSNPAIFEKAIARSDRYDSAIRMLLSEKDYEVRELFEKLAIRDIQGAADLFSETYKKTGNQDGMVSLEVAPFLAHDAEGTYAEGVRLWKAVSRPNLMIKVPGTPEGLIAFEKLTFEGINVNVTLLFSRDVYERFIEGYQRALEKRLSAGRPLASITSVASFFVSRIDVAADKKIQAALSSTLDRDRREALEALLGRVAVANAQLAYDLYEKSFSGPRWDKLKSAGARPQRILWASTGTKNPNERDVRYLEELIGNGTVNTLPPQTLAATVDHAKIENTLENTAEEARHAMVHLEALGISIEQITSELLDEGIALFNQPFQSLLNGLECKRRLFLKPPLNEQELSLPILLETEIGRTLQLWKREERVRKLWKRDSKIWTQSGEENWMGWLSIPERQLARAADFRDLAQEIGNSGLRDAVILGMGGSSLCADVLSSIYEPSDRFPDLHILDSTHPDQIRALESMLDLEKTLFIVSSKSGATLEPNILLDYFYDQIEKSGGPHSAGSHFMAITDPGSELETLALQRKFRRIFHGLKNIGGRYSALSDFGMVPAAILGMDCALLLRRSIEMMHACSPNVEAEDNPGLVLGAVLGTLAMGGRDKVTILCSPEIWDFGAWMEQLMAESTGKLGKGLIPICEEKIGSPSSYGRDRVFVYLKLEGTIDGDLDQKIEELEKAEFPVIEIRICDRDGLIQEFYRWEFAVAVAGSVMGLNPFDQPDVEAAKVAAKNLTSEYERTGSLPEEKPFFENEELALYADPRHAMALQTGAQKNSPAAILSSHLGSLCQGDYFGILGFLPMSFELESVFGGMRTRIRDLKKVATCLGFGPRYLHSTGQLYKGGPASGVFLLVTADYSEALPIPGKSYGFSVVNQAQARGDSEVLTRRGRRLLRVHLKTSDMSAVARRLEQLFEEATR